MRTIKFRGKRPFIGGWLYGLLDIQGDDVEIFSRENNTFTKGIVIPKTIGQFTGLYDKNGNEIYEGDILNMPKKHLKKDQQVYESTGEVYFEKGVFRCDQIPLAYLNLDELEIIGNIYDNPKLLKE